MIESLKQKYGVDYPIFTSDILKSQKDISRSGIFNELKKAKEEGIIKEYDKGIYYFPTTTFLGDLSSLSYDLVLERKYIRDEGKIFGLYTGAILLERFGLSTQIPNIREITTNIETTNERNIRVGSWMVSLKKPRVEITNDNIDVITLLELFAIMEEKDFQSNPYAQDYIFEFIDEKNLTNEKIEPYLKYYPPGTTYKLMLAQITYYVERRKK